MSYRRFRLVRAGVPLSSFLAEIEARPGDWEAITGRQSKIKVQRETRSVPLRGMRKSAQGERKGRDVHDSRWTTTSQHYPAFRRLLEDLAKELDGILGRAKIVCLPRGRKVYPHIDRGEYYRVRDRYHLVLKSSLGSWLKAGDEEIRMREGELWWFDNKQMHEAFNDGDEDRIHLIFDMLPSSRVGEVGEELSSTDGARKMRREDSASISPR